MNGDGIADLAVANEGGDRVGVLLGDGDGTFQQVATYSSGGTFPTSVAIADVNGDGKPDLLVANCDASRSSSCVDESLDGVVGVLLGNGDGTFQAALAYECSDDSSERQPIWTENEEPRRSSHWNETY